MRRLNSLNFFIILDVLHHMWKQLPFFHIVGRSYMLEKWYCVKCSHSMHHTLWNTEFILLCITCCVFMFIKNVAEWWVKKTIWKQFILLLCIQYDYFAWWKSFSLQHFLPHRHSFTMFLCILMVLFLSYELLSFSLGHHLVLCCIYTTFLIHHITSTQYFCRLISCSLIFRFLESW